jgi:hypothetical protein
MRSLDRLHDDANPAEGRCHPYFTAFRLDERRVDLPPEIPVLAAIPVGERRRRLDEEVLIGLSSSSHT